MQSEANTQSPPRQLSFSKRVHTSIHGDESLYLAPQHAQPIQECQKIEYPKPDGVYSFDLLENLARSLRAQKGRSGSPHGPHGLHRDTENRIIAASNLLAPLLKCLLIPKVE